MSEGSRKVALRTNRRFAGMEIDPHWAELARKRIRNVTPALPME